MILEGCHAHQRIGRPDQRANRGLGLAFARELVRRGAAKVYGGAREVLADERSQDVKAKLSRDHELIYPPIQAFWDAAVCGAC